jgi:hypothetical protein
VERNKVNNDIDNVDLVAALDDYDGSGGGGGLVVPNAHSSDSSTVPAAPFSVVMGGGDDDAVFMPSAVVPTRPPHNGVDLREYFGDDLTYVIDARLKGNIGRFLNHSCEPNMIVQNMLVDTHDLRLPWFVNEYPDNGNYRLFTFRVSFWAKEFIAAGTELVWFYGYEAHPDPAKRVPCNCGTEQCRGFLR